MLEYMESYNYDVWGICTILSRNIPSTHTYFILLCSKISYVLDNLKLFSDVLNFLNKKLNKFSDIPLFIISNYCSN